VPSTGPASLERVTVGAADGLALSARVGGVGRPVVLLHGFTGSGSAWGETLTGALASRCRVVAPDLVGHGSSAHPHDPRRYAPERVLADVAAVQAALVEGPATWIGYSMGGRLALAGALERVAPVEALVLESASPGLESAVERAERRRADEAWARRLDEEGIEAFVDAWLAQPLFATQRDLSPELRRDERARRLEQDPRALAACLRGLGTGVQTSHWDELERLSVPVLLVTGERDAKFTALARRMEARLPAGRHEPVAGAGHAVHLEAPAAWLERVTAFLARLGGA
jgi:2-succinyl-6-hydroxy-2,4-cyclohexadiene-1-carboxylate synthase